MTMTDTRPSNCRFRLADEGKPYPRSGCNVTGCNGVFGALCKSINAITSEDVETFQIVLDSPTCDSNALDVYQELATKHANYPGRGTALGLAYCALKLNGEAGELAEHVGKAMRDDRLIESTGHPHQYADGKSLTPERRAVIIKEIGDNLWYLSAVCKELGIDLSEAATANLQKLADRTKRETLRGSGDDR